jgi:hypothetical protein
VHQFWINVKTNEKELESKLDPDHESSKHQHYINTKMRRNRSAKKRETIEQDRIVEVV